MHFFENADTCVLHSLGSSDGFFLIYFPNSNFMVQEIIYKQFSILDFYPLVYLLRITVKTICISSCPCSFLLLQSLFKRIGNLHYFLSIMW